MPDLCEKTKQFADHFSGECPNPSVALDREHINNCEPCLKTSERASMFMRSYWVLSYTHSKHKDAALLWGKIVEHTLHCEECRVDSPRQRDGSYHPGFAHCGTASVLIDTLDFFEARMADKVGWRYGTVKLLGVSTAINVTGPATVVQGKENWWVELGKTERFRCKYGDGWKKEE